MKLPIIDLT